MPPAIAGQGGHAATFRAACKLAEFDLSEAEALAVLSDWNQTHCQPPWRESDLRHKITDAFKHAPPQPKHVVSSAPVFSPPPSPRMANGQSGQIAELARLRGLSLEGVALADGRGLVRFGIFQGKAAWFITDSSGRVAQARRMDGQCWAGGVKALTLAGSQAKWPVGIGEVVSFRAEHFPVIALCEGGPDLLAACHFIVAQGMAGQCVPVAMLGASCPIHSDALPLFGGKRVRIFPHLDDSGQAAARRWAEQLLEVGADVDAFSFSGLCREGGKPVKDFNDLAKMGDSDFQRYPCLRSLFPKPVAS